MKKLILFSFSSLFFFSCYYDKLEEIKPTVNTGTNTTSCTDTAGVTDYTNKVKPIMDTYCKGCHSGGTPSGGILLDNFASVKAQGESGKLLSSVNWDGTASKMPKNGSQLTDCKIQVIKKWISTGYKE